MNGKMGGFRGSNKEGGESKSCFIALQQLRSLAPGCGRVEKSLGVGSLFQIRGEHERIPCDPTGL